MLHRCSSLVLCLSLGLVLACNTPVVGGSKGQTRAPSRGLGGSNLGKAGGPPADAADGADDVVDSPSPSADGGVGTTTDTTTPEVIVGKGGSPSPTPSPSTDVPAPPSFGGVYSEYLNGECHFKNPYTNACSCPTTNTFNRVIIDHFENATDEWYHHCAGTLCGFNTYVCQATTLDPGFGGMYATYGRNNPTKKCFAKNGYTNDCSCPEPSRYLPYQVDRFDQNRKYYCLDNDDNCQLDIFFCSDRSQLGASKVGGFFSFEHHNNNNPIFTNLHNNAITCPDGFQAALFAEFDDPVGPFFRGGRSVYYCYK